MATAKELKKTIKDTQKQIQNLRKDLKRIAKDAIKELSKEVFENHPQLVSIGWRQYTPYFNDGSECTFGVERDLDLVFKDKDGEEVEFKFGEADNLGRTFDHTLGKSVDVPLSKDEKAYSKAAKDANKFLAVFRDEDLEELLGDHVSVTITRKGLATEEYSHD